MKIKINKKLLLEITGGFGTGPLITMNGTPNMKSNNPLVLQDKYAPTGNKEDKNKKDTN